MMISSSCGFCVLFPQNPKQLQFPFPLFNQLSSSHHSACISNLDQLNHNNNNNKKNESPVEPPPAPLISRRRRKFLMLTTMAPFLSTRTSRAAETETDEVLELERYTDVNQGFTLLRPASWIKVEKAGATVLFEDPSKGSNNVGVVVTPVRLTTLPQFGDPEFVSNKLIQAEKRKESTKDVQLLSFMERPHQKGVYEFEYKLDSTRGGLKRIFSAAFVASNKLYLLNIAHSDNPQQPITNKTRIMLEQILHSFDLVNTQI